MNALLIWLSALCSCGPDCEPPPPPVLTCGQQLDLCIASIPRGDKAAVQDCKDQWKACKMIRSTTKEAR